ncbi:hypothetical protein ZWY2020_043504 [Hordeum vulgare]|nr:hypothetical protein ZWY2020_043504 [Hordeum vulgare]
MPEAVAAPRPPKEPSFVGSNNGSAVDRIDLSPASAGSQEPGVPEAVSRKEHNKKAPAPANTSAPMPSKEGKRKSSSSNVTAGPMSCDENGVDEGFPYARPVVRIFPVERIWNGKGPVQWCRDEGAVVAVLGSAGSCTCPICGNVVMEKRRLRLGKAVYQDLNGEAELDEKGYHPNNVFSSRIGMCSPYNILYGAIFGNLSSSRSSVLLQELSANVVEPHSTPASYNSAPLRKTYDVFKS